MPILRLRDESGTVYSVPALIGPQGPQGEKGNTGEQGPAGYTPVKGTDYWTATDIAEINTYIDNSVSTQIGTALEASY